MRTYAAGDQNSGCFWVRTKLPFDHFTEEVSYLSQGDGFKPSEVDAMQFARGYEGELQNLYEIVDTLKRARKAVVYDLDDAMHLVQRDNIYHDKVRSALPSVYYLLNAADLVTVSTPLLKEELQKYVTAPIHIFPNCIDTKQWIKRPKTSSKPRIGFAGSNSHILDINFILPIIKRLKALHDFDFVLFGFNSEETKTPTEWADKNIDVFTKANITDHPFLNAVKEFKELVADMDIEFVPMQNWKFYPAKLASLDLDIGIAPLLDTPFNRCKSSIKFYEYATVGTATIASDVPPFSGEVDTVVPNDPEEWFKALEFMLLFPEYRAQRLKEQEEWVLKNRNIDDYAPVLEEQYAQCLNKLQKK